MIGRPSSRLEAVVDALPLKPGMRVLEIGCGPGVCCRAVAARTLGTTLGIDRSAGAIERARALAATVAPTLRLEFRHVAVEDFTLASGEAPFDLAFAIRVGVLDGRHPDGFGVALARIRAALVPDGQLYIDGGDPLRLLPLR